MRLGILSSDGYFDKLIYLNSKSVFPKILVPWKSSISLFCFVFYYDFFFHLLKVILLYIISSSLLGLVMFD